MTHQLSVIIYSLSFLPLFLLNANKSNLLNNVRALIMVGLYTSGITAVFTYPLYFEKDSVNFHVLIHQTSEISERLVGFSELAKIQLPKQYEWNIRNKISSSFVLPNATHLLAICFSITINLIYKKIQTLYHKVL